VEMILAVLMVLGIYLVGPMMVGFAIVFVVILVSRRAEKGLAQGRSSGEGYQSDPQKL